MVAGAERDLDAVRVIRNHGNRCYAFGVTI
jgi:hypothetical protein